MKIVRLIIAAFVVVLATGLSANAQKIGYVDGETIVALLPETKIAQEKLQKWQVDSVGGEYQRLLAEYQEQDSILKKTTTPSVKQLIEKRIEEIAYTLQNWQQATAPAIQAKTAQFLGPIYEKVRKTIQDVAKEKGYTYVLAPDILIVSPPGDDLTPAVATKLGVKLPAPGAGAPAARN